MPMPSTPETHGVVTLHWNAPPGQPYTIQVSPDLQTWTLLATHLISTNPLQSWSTNALPGKAFYRLKW
jgi:hypothetical protein